VAEDRAQILAQAGDADPALDEIERLLARPSRLSVGSTRSGTRSATVRLQALLTKYAAGHTP